MCQWVQAYSMSAPDFKTIMHTFDTVFSHVTVWEASMGGDYLLIGSPQPLKADYSTLLDRLGDRNLLADLSKMRIWDPATFFNKLVHRDEGCRRLRPGSAPEHGRCQPSGLFRSPMPCSWADRPVCWKSCIAFVHRRRQMCWKISMGRQMREVLKPNWLP